MNRKRAIGKLQKVENALRHAQAIIIGYADDLKAIRVWLEGADKKTDKKADEK